MRFAAARGADADTAADVVAETFIAALKARSRYRPTQDSARLWLLAIAARKLADVRRWEDREQRRLGRAVEYGAVVSDRDRESYASTCDRLAATDALADLPEAERQVLLARVVQDRTYAEIAEALGVTEATTRKRASRGLARLRALLERP